MCTDEIKNYLLNNARDAVDFIISRDKDYSISEFSDDIAVDFFGYARPMTIVINSVKYTIDCMTTLNTAKAIKDALDNGFIEYIAETSNDIDNIVGNIDDFILQNSIDNSDYLATERYYKIVEDNQYKISIDDIVRELKRKW